jgi:hypothetical protein
VAERQDSDREVLTSLPRSRPVRRSAKRSDRQATATGAKTQPRRAAPGSPRAKKAAGAAGAQAGAAKAGATRAAKPGATRAAKPGATRAARPAAKTARPASDRVRSAPPKRKVPPAGYAAPTSRAEEPATSGTAELISTTIQATAELAQIGLTVGRQTLQSMLDRLPKP